jgi:hypothetical protein
VAVFDREDARFRERFDRRRTSPDGQKKFGERERVVRVREDVFEDAPLLFLRRATFELREERACGLGSRRESHEATGRRLQPRTDGGGNDRLETFARSRAVAAGEPRAEFERDGRENGRTVVAFGERAERPLVRAREAHGGDEPFDATRAERHRDAGAEFEREIVGNRVGERNGDGRGDRDVGHAHGGADRIVEERTPAARAPSWGEIVARAGDVAQPSARSAKRVFSPHRHGIPLQRGHPLM